MNQAISCPAFVPVPGGALMCISVRTPIKRPRNLLKTAKKTHSQCEGQEFDSP